MPYVSNADIIAYIDNEINFIQGNSQNYEIFLFKDFLNNPLNLSQPTSIKVSIWNNVEKLLQYTVPFSSGSSGEINLDLNGNTGKIDFTITAEQSSFITTGELFAEITIIYENFYPQPKTYVFEKLKIGQMIADDTNEPENPEVSPESLDLARFVLEYVNNNNPSDSGRMSTNSQIPAEVTKITFRNLDKNLVRVADLENFLTKRISADEINGIITLYDTSDSNLYAIYRIEAWERVDIITGNNNFENVDGIKLTVSLEGISTGPGVSKSLWEVGMNISYTLDAHGITGTDIKPDGVLTYVDKGLHPTTTTNGNSSQTGVTITHTPYNDSYVNVEINGISVELSNGTKDKDVYFSSDGGVTAVNIEEIRSGDELIWNGTITGYELTVEDEINLIYEADAELLN